MGLSLGLIGLANSGKTTLFNALTRGTAQVSTHASGRTEPNIGKVLVPDPRMEVLQRIVKGKRIVPAEITFTDIAGLAPGARQASEGLGSAFLNHIRLCDALVAVLRGFDNPAAPPALGGLNPVEELEVLTLELIMADLAVVDKALEKREKMSKIGAAAGTPPLELEALRKVKAALDAGRPARRADLSAEALRHIQHMTLLTLKPVLYVLNVGEDHLTGSPSPFLEPVRVKAADEGAEALPICARLEAEVAELPLEEAPSFLREMGVQESGLDRLIRACYAQLDLITFFTAGEPEVKAWTVPAGAKAVDGAHAIHSDIARGFIRAETVHYDDYARLGSMAAMKEAGLVRLEGKEYPLKDGDVIYFRFNV